MSVCVSGQLSLPLEFQWKEQQQQQHESFSKKKKNFFRVPLLLLLMVANSHHHVHHHCGQTWTKQKQKHKSAPNARN